MKVKAECAQAWVCVDCLFGIHFGADSIENPDPRWDRQQFRKSTRAGEWSDWTCVCHEYAESWCEHCDSDEDGTNPFSMTKCDCCNSTVAGSRHRFRFYPKK